jgi:hypothetical protein
VWVVTGGSDAAIGGNHLIPRALLQHLKILLFNSGSTG